MPLLGEFHNLDSNPVVAFGQLGDSAKLQLGADLTSKLLHLDELVPEIDDVDGSSRSRHQVALSARQLQERRSLFSGVRHPLDFRWNPAGFSQTPHGAFQIRRESPSAPWRKLLGTHGALSRKFLEIHPAIRTAGPTSPRGHPSRRAVPARRTPGRSQGPRHVIDGFLVA